MSFLIAGALRTLGWLQVAISACALAQYGSHKTSPQQGYVDGDDTHS